MTQIYCSLTRRQGLSRSDVYHRRKVGLKYFSDTCRVWLLIRSLTWETSVSWKRNVSRAFQSYIPIEGANLLGKSHFCYHPFHRTSRIRCSSERAENSDRYFEQPLRTSRVGVNWKLRRRSARISTLIGIVEEGAGMFDNSLMRRIIKRMAKQSREKSRRSASLAGTFRFNDASTARRAQRRSLTFGPRIIFFFAANGKRRSCFPCINVNELWTPIQCTSVARNMAVSRFGRVAIGARVVNAVEQIDDGDKGETVAWHWMTVKRYN